MKRSFVLAKVVVLLALMVGLMVSSVSVVGASASQAVSGTWQIVSITPISAQPVNRNCIIELVVTIAFQGDLEGTITDHLRIVHFGPCDQPAAEVVLGEGTFEGTVAGASGTFDFVSQGDVDAQGNLQGQFVIQGGTGGLANLHGEITVTGQLGVGTGTYSADIYFDRA